MNKQSETDLLTFLDELKIGVEDFLQRIDFASLKAAADLIVLAKEQGNRLHISGIGKPAHIANYIASLFSSTGTPAYFLHGTEAVHGSCGQLIPGDIVIFISNSGETMEMVATILAVKANGCKVIGVSGDSNSWLARGSDVHLFAGVENEGGPLGRAPRVSIIAEIIILQALSVLLQSEAGITTEQYIKWHPSGSLGKM